jgi:hypothetical protein
VLYADLETRRLLVRDHHIDLARDARSAHISRPVVVENRRRVQARLRWTRIRLRPVTDLS